MKLTGENRRTRGGGGGEPVPVPLCPPQNPHGLTLDFFFFACPGFFPL
jgi:hypothetical protein